ncbi:MAG: class I SAM-dependent methyltransferase [Actinobacteria bacterium]|nr:class I SAM-dependent methyltransferase [Actinomycetota bacterium]
MDLQEMKERSRNVWGLGDYSPTGRQLEPVSVALVESLGIGAGHRVLDVAAGNGNCALAAARAGASVVASDFSPVMIERGRERTVAAEVDVAWEEADAAALPFEDGAFDRVTSVFGAIFAPEQELTARELARVTAPGGVMGMTAWTVDGLIARMIRELRPSDAPAPPEDAPDPMAWGDPDHVERLFADVAGELSIARRTVTFSYASWDQWRRDFGVHGMMVVMKNELPPEEFEALLSQARDFVAGEGRVDGDGVAYDAEYLEIRVDVPA